MKQNKLKLNGATISGPGMTHAINPSIITGPEDNGYAKGELMDANAVKKTINSSTEQLSKLLFESGLDDNKINSMSEIISMFDGMTTDSDLSRGINIGAMPDEGYESIRSDIKNYNQWDFYVTVQMIYSDNYTLLHKWFNNISDEELCEKVYQMSINWLDDEDNPFGSKKIWRYFNNKK